jgi:anthranilate phosphoribosyltransferase
MIRDAIKKAVTGQDLSETEAEGAVHDILSGKATFAQAGALLTALRMKGETVDEITGAARAIQSRVIKLHLHNGLVNLDRDDINIEEETILQTCDTGANGTHTFNVSTATAFVVAGGGIRVARHGDRVISRRFGAADVLEHLGVKLDLPRSAVERCIEELNIGFIFGPLFKEPMRTLGGLRGEIGIRTIFNLVGPLSNPTNASTHVLGVYDPSLTEKMAHVFKRLGARVAFVVCGEGTYDEISICGPTKVSRLRQGEIATFDIEPEQFGLQRARIEEIRGGNAKTNAEIIRNVLGGETGPKRDIVALNAAAAFVAAGLDPGLEQGIERAAGIIDSGKALEKLDALVEFTNRYGSFVRKEFA